MEITSRVAVSAREAEVLALLAQRLSNAQIANRMHMSVRTVEGHVSALLRKYGAPDRRTLADIGMTGDRVVPPPSELAELPAFRTSFVGRIGEQEEILRALRQGGLITLVGPGGVGKTRLATVVAARVAPTFGFGGAFVDLVPAAEGFVAQAVAAALGLTENPQQTLANAIVSRLSRGRALLVLDNCEHVINAVANFAELVLSACPNTTILATSRERVGLPDEHVITIGPLPSDSAATQLFLERASAAEPHLRADPALVADVCARLDGLPLAIELAAARAASLGTSGLLTALGDYLRVLAGGRGANVRHRSLRTVLDWSHNLLDDEERLLFRRISVFTGSLDLAAASAVAQTAPAVTADLLGRLVDKSLMVAQPVSGRWRMLATIRAYAQEQLAASGESDHAQQSHLHWATHTAAALRARQGGGWEDFDTVVDDLRAALRHSAAGPNTEAHDLARSLGRLTFARRFLVEAIGHFRHAATLAPTPALAARDLLAAADCAMVMYTADARAFDLLLASAEQALAARDGGRRAIALARASMLPQRFTALSDAAVPIEELRRLHAEAVSAAGDAPDPIVRAHLAAAAAWAAASTEPDCPDAGLAEIALQAAHAAGDPVLISAALDAVLTAELAADRPWDAYLHAKERLQLLDQLDAADPSAAVEVVDLYTVATSSAIDAGDISGALTMARQMRTYDLFGDHYFATSMLIAPLVLTGEFDEAIEHGTAMWDGWTNAGGPVVGSLWLALGSLAMLYGLRGDREGHDLWRSRIAKVAGPGNAHRMHGSPTIAFPDTRVAIHLGDTTDAADLVERSFTLRRRSTAQRNAYATGAELAVVAGLPDAAHRLAVAADRAADNDWAKACLMRANGRLHRDLDSISQAIRAWQRLGARAERACTLALHPQHQEEAASEFAALGISEQWSV